MSTFFTELMFCFVSVYRDFIQVQTACFACVALFLAYALYTVHFALVHKFLTEFVMRNVAQVLIVCLAYVHILFLFLVVADYKMRNAFFKTSFDYKVHNLVEVIVYTVKIQKKMIFTSDKELLKSEIFKWLLRLKGNRSDVTDFSDNEKQEIHLRTLGLYYKLHPKKAMEDLTLNIGNFTVALDSLLGLFSRLQ